MEYQYYRRRFDEVMEIEETNKRDMLLANLMTQMESQNAGMMDMVTRKDNLGELYRKVSKARY